MLHSVSRFVFFGGYFLFLGFLGFSVSSRVVFSVFVGGDFPGFFPRFYGFSVGCSVCFFVPPPPPPRVRLFVLVCFCGVVSFSSGPCKMEQGCGWNGIFLRGYPFWLVQGNYKHTAQLCCYDCVSLGGGVKMGRIGGSWPHTEGRADLNPKTRADRVNRRTPKPLDPGQNHQNSQGRADLCKTT